MIVRAYPLSMVLDNCICQQLLRAHGVDGAEVSRVFGAVDMDNTGRLHYMEFLAATIEARGYIEVRVSLAQGLEIRARLIAPEE